MNITKKETGEYHITATSNEQVARCIDLTKEEAEALSNSLGYEKDVSDLRQQFLQKVDSGILSKEEVDFALSNKPYVDTMIENIACGMNEWEMSYSEAFDAALEEYGYPRISI